MLIIQTPFGHARSIKPGAIELKSRRLTEAARVSDRNNGIMKQKTVIIWKVIGKVLDMQQTSHCLPKILFTLI